MNLTVSTSGKWPTISGVVTLDGRVIWETPAFAIRSMAADAAAEMRDNLHSAGDAMLIAMARTHVMSAERHARTGGMDEHSARALRNADGVLAYLAARHGQRPERFTVIEGGAA